MPTEESIVKLLMISFRANRRAVEKEPTKMARQDVSEFTELSDDFMARNGLKKATRRRRCKNRSWYKSHRRSSKRKLVKVS